MAIQDAFDFVARWRLATSFRGIKAEGYPEDSVSIKGYDALLRHVLACGAKERLADVLKTSHDSLSIDNSALAERVRGAFGKDRNSQFARSLTKRRLSQSDKEHLQEFWSGESDDVWPISFLIRNGVAHGSLTATGMALGSKGRLAVIQDLTEAVLHDSDERFTAWGDKRVGLHA